MTEDFSLRTGTQLSHYRIIKTLGQGGFGITYQAWDDQLNRLVAIKEYFPHGQATRAEDARTVRIHPADMPAYAKGLERFLDEARTLAQFRDPRIVHVHGFKEAHNTAYMVMDFEEGLTLRDHVLQHGILSPAEAQRVLIDILCALQIIHARNYLHRDIKPANILRRPNGSVLLLDFGSARMAQLNQEQAFTIIITPGYAPLEQYSNHEAQGPATDLYAVGACLLFCLTGSLPVDALKRTIAENASEKDPLEPLLTRTMMRHVTDNDLTDVLRWLLQSQAAQRPQSAAEVLQRLDSAPAARTNTTRIAQLMDHRPTQVDLSQLRSIPSKMVEPIRQQLHEVFGDNSTQILVQAIRRARNAQNLVDNLANQLTEHPRRIYILNKISNLLTTAALNSVITSNPPRPSQSPAPATRMAEVLKDEETTQLLSNELANFIGPIARMLVKKRAVKAANVPELVTLLSEEIATPADRIAFRKALIKLKIIAD